MIKVYVPPMETDIFREWFNNTIDFVPCYEIDQVFEQDLKIACLPVYFDKPDSGCYVNDVYNRFDLILLSDIEFSHIDPVTKWIKKLKIKNYLLALGGLEGYTLSGDAIYRPWWTFNLMSKNTLQHKDVENPPYEFDILLGAKKPHRDFVMAKCQNSFLLEKSIVNYREAFRVPQDAVVPDTVLNNHIDKVLNGKQLNYPYVSDNIKHEWEVRPEITYQVSDQVPWGIYNQTKYSTVLETVYQNGVFFFSEKPAKALYGKRIFVVFSCYGYLKQMKEVLGFKTFDGIIDERYDQEKDDIKRFEMAFDQMEKLAKQDYQKIKEQAEPIVDYNFHRLFTLRQEISDQMQQMVYNKIKEIKQC